jgi:hypothetical protein
MATTEIFFILAYCSPMAHGVLAASWTRFSTRRLLRRMVFMVPMSNSHRVNPRYRSPPRLLSHTDATPPLGVQCLSVRLYILH